MSCPDPLPNSAQPSASWRKTGWLLSKEGIREHLGLGDTKPNWQQRCHSGTQRLNEPIDTGCWDQPLSPFWHFRLQEPGDKRSFLGHQTRPREIPKLFDFCGCPTKPDHPKERSLLMSPMHVYRASDQSFTSSQRWPGISGKPCVMKSKAPVDFF